MIIHTSFYQGVFDKQDLLVFIKEGWVKWYLFAFSYHPMFLLLYEYL